MHYLNHDKFNNKLFDTVRGEQYFEGKDLDNIEKLYSDINNNRKQIDKKIEVMFDDFSFCLNINHKILIPFSITSLKKEFISINSIMHSSFAEVNRNIRGDLTIAKI